jgi:hypothetical protein
MKHRFTPEQRLRGLRKAIRTLEGKRGGPKWLLPSMRRYERKLTEEIRAGGAGKLVLHG